MEPKPARVPPSPNLEGFPDAPRITLADKEWPIPELVVKQNRIIEPRVSRIYGPDKSKDRSFFDETEYDLALDIIAAALTRAHPDFRRDDLMEMRVNQMQLLKAMDVIIKQTGIFESVKAEAATPGE